MADTTKSPKKSRLRYIPRKATKKGEVEKKAAGKPGLYGTKPKPKAATVKNKPAKKPETDRMKAAKKARLRYIPRSK
jgi:hypothetical protein